jgi:hypothetical protein
MSFARIPNDNGDSVVGFDSVPAECSVRIFQFLDVDDLANVAQVSRRFHENTLHPSIQRRLLAFVDWTRAPARFLLRPVLSCECSPTRR